MSYECQSKIRPNGRLFALRRLLDDVSFQVPDSWKASREMMLRKDPNPRGGSCAEPGKKMQVLRLERLIHLLLFFVVLLGFQSLQARIGDSK